MSTPTDFRRAILAAPVGWLPAEGIAPARSDAALKRRAAMRLGAWASALLAPSLTWATTASAEAAWFDAASRGDVPQLQRLVAAGILIDRRDAAGRTALLRATAANRLEAARWLIERGADVNAKDAIDDSPYLLAGARGHTDILRLTLAAGADLRSTNRYGGTALIPAAHYGHVETVRLLLGTAVDVNHVNRLGWTALLEAIILGDGGAAHTEIVRLLLAAGARHDIADAQGVTPLAHARQRGQGAIMRLLEAAGARR
jgi:ankyrin repeat protein